MTQTMFTDAKNMLCLIYMFYRGISQVSELNIYANQLTLFYN